jgi:hypothetical protein
VKTYKKIRKISRFNCEKIGKIWKKDKLKSEKIMKNMEEI